MPSNAVVRHVHDSFGTQEPADLKAVMANVARHGATPIAVAVDGEILGIIALSDVLKHGIRKRTGQLRSMGIRTVMVTGDNPLTAAAIAAEAGVDDFVAEAKPEDKLQLIRREQAQGRLVAMSGDGTNDAPALAQADVGLAMHSGTMAAKEAANLIDLDSDPTKLLDVVEIGKQMLVTRGALTTFSIANDVAKYFAISTGSVHGCLARARGIEHYAISEAAKRHFVGPDLQRTDYSYAYSACLARSPVQTKKCRRYVLSESSHLWRRWADCSFHRH